MDLKPVRDYYQQKFGEFGKTHAGVDWNSYEAQYTRFRQLAKLLDETGSVGDWGCGYGAFQKFCPGEYVGYDIVPHEGNAFVLSDRPTQKHDYIVASGLFNVKLDKCPIQWRLHVEDCWSLMDKMSTKGFAFNLLSTDAQVRNSKLYYADPREVFEVFREYYSKRVAILHDYSHWDFTVIVRKDADIR